MANTQYKFYFAYITSPNHPFSLSRTEGFLQEEPCWSFWLDLNQRLPSYQDGTLYQLSYRTLISWELDSLFSLERPGLRRMPVLTSWHAGRLVDLLPDHQGIAWFTYMPTQVDIPAYVSTTLLLAPSGNWCKVCGPTFRTKNGILSAVIISYLNLT